MDHDLGHEQAFTRCPAPEARGPSPWASLAMMADSIEHVISYWILFREAQSPALGGFAVVSHWLPFLPVYSRSPSAGTRAG